MFIFLNIESMIEKLLGGRPWPSQDKITSELDKQLGSIGIILSHNDRIGLAALVAEYEREKIYLN